MKLCQFLLLLFVLWDRKPGLTEAKAPVFKAVEGGEKSIHCRSYENLKVNKRKFCKNDCNEEDILVETSGNKQQNGRYSIVHVKKESPPLDMISVKITNLTRSDSGRYRCFWEAPEKSSNSEFIIEVLEAPKDGKPALTEAETAPVYTATEGESFEISCLFYFIGNKKMFCKKNCGEDVLVETSGNNQENGRYSVKYSNYSDMSAVAVKIINVSRSDAGPYQCVLDKSVFTFWINVTFASSPAPFTVSPPEVPPASSPAPFTVSPPEVPPASSPAPFTESPPEVPPASSPAPFTESPPEVPPEQSLAAPSEHFYLLLVIVVVAAVAIILTVVSLIVYKKRRSRNDQRTTENVRDSEAEENNYENICPPPTSEPGESTYQSLILTDMDQS